MSKHKQNFILVGVGLSAIAHLILPTGLAGLLVIMGCGLAAIVASGAIKCMKWAKINCGFTTRSFETIVCREMVNTCWSEKHLRMCQLRRELFNLFSGNCTGTRIRAERS